MRRHRTRIVLFCLLALVWCQLTAAAQLCGTHAESDVAAASASPPCHGDDTRADHCMATGCPAAQALKDAYTSGFALDMAPPADAFGLVLTLAAERYAAASRAPHRPTGPPPHFLGRLLI